MSEPLYNWRPTEDFQYQQRSYVAVPCAEPLCLFVIVLPEACTEKIGDAVFYCPAGHAQRRQPEQPKPADIAAARDEGFDEGFLEGRVQEQVESGWVERLLADAKTLTEWIDKHQIEPTVVTVAGAIGMATLEPAELPPDSSGASAMDRPESRAGPVAPEGEGPPETFLDLARQRLAEPPVPDPPAPGARAAWNGTPLDEQILAYAATVEEFRPADLLTEVTGDWSTATMGNHLAELVNGRRLEHPRHGIYRLAQPKPAEPPVPEPPPTRSHAGVAGDAIWACPANCGQGPFISRRLLDNHCRHDHRTLDLSEYEDAELVIADSVTLGQARGGGT